MAKSVGLSFSMPPNHYSFFANNSTFFGSRNLLCFFRYWRVCFFCCCSNCVWFFFCFKQTPYKYSHIFAQYNLFGCDTYSGLFQYPLKVVKKNKINKFIRSSVLDAMFCFLYFAFCIICLGI